MAKGRGTQGLMGDGITVCGRLTGFLGVFVLLFFVVALFTPNWSTTDELNMGGGLEVVSEATFGLREYCLKTSTATFVEEQFVCFEYDDTLRVRLANNTIEEALGLLRESDSPGGGLVSAGQICGPQLAAFEATVSSRAAAGFEDNYQWVNYTGCDRFDNVCSFENFEIIRVLVMAAAICCVAGATFSEKVTFYGIMLFLAMLLGVAAASTWGVWQASLDSNLEAEIGLGILAGGIVFALLGSLLAMCDKCQGNDKAGLGDDGIDLFGRMGSLLTVATWLFLAMAVVMPTWTTVDNLGSVGGLCNDDCLHAECDNIKATFGLTRFCVDTSVALTGNAKKESVCAFYFDKLAVVGNETEMDGFERFEEYNLETSVRLTMACVIIGVACSALADIFSEKLIPAAVLSCATGIAGVVALITWSEFQNGIADAVPGTAESSDGMYVLGTAFAVAFFTMLIYGVNACKYYRSEKASISA